MDKSPAELSNELFYKVETTTAGLHGLAELMMACDPEMLEDDSILTSLGHLLRIVAKDLFTHADQGYHIKFPPIAPPALGLLISSAANSSDRAMSIVPLALVPQIVFALALVPLPATLAWLSYATTSRFAMEAFGSITQLPLPRDYSDCVIPCNPRSCAIYPSVDYDPGGPHVLQLWGTLAGYTLVCLILTTIILAAPDRKRH